MMKHARVFWLVAVGALLFAIGLFIPLAYHIVRSVLLIAGVALVFLFYLSTLIEVISAKSMGSRKIFWLVAIVCMPVVGNLLYILTQDLTNQKQTPRLQNF